ncbi:molybdate transport system permease protein [Leucobacter luti]|uniref:Molybdenum transport system permease n=1 Tax=Leucobacter luti TaxID=340320 RepID=A0A4R6S458_9MICO|nr:ABC transporter permease [Leucobacter luti]TDP94450.1 molybdate transport system permease protein [Leucobacter luti]
MSERAAGIPGGLYIPAAVGGGLLLLPLIALLARIDWATIPNMLVAPETANALRVSLVTAATATALCLVLGIPLALVIARARGWLATALRALVTLPLVLPPLVGGLALLSLLGRGGVLGDWLAELGIRIPFTTVAVIIAQTFVALPFLVISVEGALRSLHPEYEEAAATLGASPTSVLFRITIPLIAPGLVAGTILSFTRALGEFGATALFAGNAAGTTRTVPMAIYTAFNGAGVTQDTALALSLILIAVAVTALAVLRGRTSSAARA